MAAFGRYELVAILGQGGFATVHRAHDPVLDRDVAIKVLHGYLAGDDQVAERFVREGRALARIRHPNLVQVYDAGTIENQTFLAMEFVDGRSLAALAANRQLPLDEAVSIISQVAGAIDAVHATGLIHRDIKPANIIVEPSGRAVLLDLGIARAMAGTSMTATGLVVGTPGFLAPEQVDSSVFVGPRTDVYQLAATAYTLLAGKPPYEGDTAQVLYSVAHKPPPDLGAERPDLPYHVIAAVTQALAKDPAHRPATATAFGAMLSGRAAVDAMPTVAAATPAATASSSLETLVAPTPVPEPEPAPKPKQPAAQPAGRSRRPVVIGVAAAAAVVLGIAGLFALLSDGGGEGTQASDDASPTPEEAFGDIRADGNSVEVRLTKGEPASLAFRAPASGTVSFVVEDSTTTAAFTVKDRRDDTVGSATWINEGGGLVRSVKLPAPGDYALQIESTGPGSATLRMYEVPKPGDKPVRPGEDFEVKVDVPGATERVTFDAKAGQRFSLSVEDASTGFQLEVVSAEDADERHAVQFIPEGGAFVDVFEVGRDDRLAIVVEPVGSESVAAKLRLYDLGPITSTTLTTQSPANFSTTKPGENAVFTFQGSHNQAVSFRTTKMKQGANLRLFEPDNGPELEVIWTPAPGGLLVATLPLDGEYRVVIDPANDTLESGTIALYDVTEHPSASATIGGGSVTVRTERPGQTGRISFSADAGQVVAVRSRGGDGYYITIAAPNGDEVRRHEWLAPNGTVADLVLPQAGEYELLLESRDRLPAAFTLELIPR